MKKQLVFGLALVAVAASWGCNDDIKVEHRTFDQLCKNSGGEIGENVLTCKCGRKEKTACQTGVICSNNGVTCANEIKKIGGESCETQGAELCSNGEEFDSGAICKCEYGTQKTGESGLVWQCQTQCAVTESSSPNNPSCNGLQCGECHNGDNKCETENDIGFLSTCEGGVWIKKECPTKICADGTMCGECSGSETKCENNARYICENGKWSIPLACDNGNSCKYDNEQDDWVCGDCRNDTTRCEAGVVEICTNGTYIKTSTDCNECSNGETKCEINTEYVCENGKWSKSKVCENGNSCKEGDDGNWVCGECRNETTKCEDGVIKICTNGTFINTDVVCTECGESETKCDNSTEYTCKDGKWSKLKVCENGNSCKERNDGKWECGDCRNETIKCSEGKLEICTNGAFEFYKTCAENKCSNAESCGECDPKVDDYKCDGNIRYLCSGGNWIESEYCENGCDIASKKCNECMDKQYKCEYHRQYECKDNKWDINSAIDCGSMSCTIDGKCGECRNDSTKCSDGKLEICTNGAFVSYKECDTGSCGSSTTCSGCKTDAQQCINNAWRKCVDGSWTELIACQYDGCKSDTECADCNENSKQCGADNVPQICKDGIWESQPSCGEGKICMNGECVSSSCDDDDDRCVDEGSGSKEYICDEHVLKAQNCVGTSCSCEKGKCEKCGECLNGEKYDEVDNICYRILCADGHLKAPVKLVNSCVYENGSYVKEGDCVNGTEKYDNNSEMVCTKYKCSLGKWVPQGTNINKYSCTIKNGVYVDNGNCNNNIITYANNPDAKDDDPHCKKESCSNGEKVVEWDENKNSCKANEKGDLIGFGDCINDKILGCYDLPESLWSNYTAVILKCADGKIPNISSLSKTELYTFLESGCPNGASCVGDRCGVCLSNWYMGNQSSVVNGKCRMENVKYCADGAINTTNLSEYICPAPGDCKYKSFGANSYIGCP